MTETPPRGRQRPTRPGFNPPKVSIRATPMRAPAAPPVTPKLNLPPAAPPVRRRATAPLAGETPSTTGHASAPADDATPLAGGGEVKVNRSGWKKGGNPPC